MRRVIVEQVIAEPPNRLPTYVASTTLTEPLEWQNSKVLQGDVADAVRALKQTDGRRPAAGDRQHRAGQDADRA